MVYIISGITSLLCISFLVLFLRERKRCLKEKERYTKAESLLIKWNVYHRERELNKKQKLKNK